MVSSTFRQINLALSLCGTILPCLSGQVPRRVRTAPTEVTVAGTALHLVVDAWLNLQPPTAIPRDSLALAPFRVIARVRAAAGARLPSGLQIDSAWVFTARRGWTAALAPDAATSDTIVVGRLWGGPLWVLKAGSVDVVVRIHARGETYQYLRAPRVRLVRAE